MTYAKRIRLAIAIGGVALAIAQPTAGVASTNDNAARLRKTGQGVFCANEMGIGK